MPTIAHAAPPAASTSAKPSATKPSAARRPQSALPDQQSLAGKFVPVKPKRLLDTRDGTGLHGIAAPVGPNSSAVLDVSGVTGNPSVTATSVVLNVTVTNPTADSFLSVAGYGSTPPSSNVNFRAGQTVPNLVTVQLYSDNMVYFFNHAGNVDVIADVFGYYTLDQSAGSFSTLPPTRVLDTRDGNGPVGSGATLPLQVTGRDSVPPTGVTAVQLNVTVTNPTDASFLSVFPGSTDLPDVSNLNFVAGQTTANSVVVPVGQDGKINIFNHSGSVDVVVDISGYFTGNPPGSVARGGVYDTYDPTRLLDTRGDGGPIGPGQSRAVKVSGLRNEYNGTPTAVVLNVTVTNPTDSSFVTAYADGSSVPTASNIDFEPGQTASNLVVVPVGADGKVDFFNHTGNTDLVVDMFGYYLAGSDLAIASLGFDKSTVDPTAGAAVVNVNWTVTDANAHATYVGGDVVLRMVGSDPNAYIGEPVVESFALNNNVGCCGAANYVSGNAQSSNYTYAFAVPADSNTTTTHWVVTLLTFSDDQGNQLTAAGSDLNGFANVVTAKTVVATSKPTNQGIYFRNVGNNRPYLYDGITMDAVYQFDAQDWADGFWQGSITVTGPGGRTLSSNFSQVRANGNQLSYPCQGDSHEQECSVPVVFPKGMTTGKWVVSKLVLTSNAGITATYDNLNTAPITVGDDGSFNASAFSITPNPVDNWRADQNLAVSMRVSGAQQGVSAIYVDADLNGSCPVPSTTPTVNPDGSYSITVRMYTSSASCGVTGIAVVDGAGEVALYGQRYFAPDPGLVANQIPDTTPPSVTSASISPASVPASTVPVIIPGTAHAAIGIAPMRSYASYVYDSTGKVVGQDGGSTAQAADGTVSFSVWITGKIPPGVYTVGLVLTDTGNLSTSYGTPGGKPMPGGPLQLTVTSG